jgi:hypothetical protein
MSHTPRARRSKPSIVVRVVLIVIGLGVQAANPQAVTPSSSSQTGDVNSDSDPASLEQAQRFFYSGEYEQAALASRRLCEIRATNLDACELRSVALLFQIKRALKATAALDKTTAWSRCTACPALMSAFLAETTRHQTLARARLKIHPDDEATLFFLGKIDLNYVWLQSGTLGRKTGWDEYWEARHSLDHVLKVNPGHVRARVARAWVDYIVGTSVPRGARWLLGGGNKKRGLLVVREVVARGEGELFVQAEAMFALWDMQVRERDTAQAVVTARTLARDFPGNAELREFLRDRDANARISRP